MTKLWIALMLSGALSLSNCQSKKGSDNLNNSAYNEADSLGTEHENTPTGSETDTFGTNPDK